MHCHAACAPLGGGVCGPPGPWGGPPINAAICWSCIACCIAACASFPKKACLSGTSYSRTPCSIIAFAACGVCSTAPTIGLTAANCDMLIKNCDQFAC